MFISAGTLVAIIFLLWVASRNERNAAENRAQDAIDRALERQAAQHQRQIEALQWAAEDAQREMEWARAEAACAAEGCIYDASKDHCPRCGEDRDPEEDCKRGNHAWQGDPPQFCTYCDVEPPREPPR